MAKEIALLVLKGDGIGPELVESTVRILKAVAKSLNLSFVFEEATIGFKALKHEGTTFPGSILEKARAADGVILGPVSHNDYPPKIDGGLNPSAELRKQLDLYANIRPAKSIEGLEARCGHPLDLVIVRENTEGFYADRNMTAGSGEFMPTTDTALALRKITRKASLRIAETAFKLANERKQKVTAVHKANVLRTSDGLFLDCVREVASRYPTTTYEETLVDATAALLVRDAGQFDVIVTTNMFGDILSDLASELAGSIGTAASLNASEDHAIAQAQHGSAPMLAGKDIANPSSLINSAAMLLDWLGEKQSNSDLKHAGVRIVNAVRTTLSNPDTRTRDLGGALGTTAFTETVIHNLDAPK